MNKSIILLSGGLDSTTCLDLAKSRQEECYALSFNYGQKHSEELNRAVEKLAGNVITAPYAGRVSMNVASLIQLSMLRITYII